MRKRRTIVVFDAPDRFSGFLSDALLGKGPAQDPQSILACTGNEITREIAESILLS
jgi:hypothetical protein